MSRGDRTRTCDSLVPNQERYQLRYTSLPLKAGAKVLKKSKSEKRKVKNLLPLMII